MRKTCPVCTADVPREELPQAVLLARLLARGAAGEGLDAHFLQAHNLTHKHEKGGSEAASYLAVSIVDFWLCGVDRVPTFSAYRLKEMNPGSNGLQISRSRFYVVKRLFS